MIGALLAVAAAPSEGLSQAVHQRHSGNQFEESEL
ncbi:MAG TPA: hypothetical protein DEF41_12215 [Desulfovibrio sp.]|uniref:Uncharacterized protein n=1 Tax=Nitratidesulfovibrio vulgaris (strain ATCC 29579 / DSM 644 / CCUG 34227 / NCIMB 8303 / VKM B-1760 / Hildenborough) TaxID=882 RepID=Q72BL9_NITV2|nr:hypothetical protein DVU_1616 [Nitratidesulfovibrio vulgaris str. Hildenborough]HBW16857.1 hypothetical protein [Desulfovibrio sp.]